MNINKYDWNNKDDYLMGLARKHDQMHQNLHLIQGDILLYVMKT